MAFAPGTVYKHADGYYADPISGGGAGSSYQIGQQGYDRLSEDYAKISADAQATRDRNMARVDQYGASMRSDLDIKNQQSLASARQSSIMRGLGNTTIQDSMVRGQNFDNNRQTMALEDQLLQNRISTDTSLSKNYQDVLQNRASGLSNLWSQNANLYQQGLQMANSNQQSQYDREFQAQQAALNRSPQNNGYANTNYANVPQYGSFGPAGYTGMTSNTFGNGGRGTFSRGR